MEGETDDNNFKMGRYVSMERCSEACGNISDAKAGGLGGWHHKGMRRELGLGGTPGHVDETRRTDLGCMFTNKRLTEQTK